MSGTRGYAATGTGIMDANQFQQLLKAVRDQQVPQPQPASQPQVPPPAFGLTPDK